jgi:hypothetical protein
MWCRAPAHVERKDRHARKEIFGQIILAALAAFAFLVISSQA